METLKDVVSELKVNIAKKLEIDLYNENYGLISCYKNNFNKYNIEKLEIIFLSNIDFLELKQNQINRVLSRNYKGLFKKKLYCIDSEDIELEEPVIVNNTKVTQNVTNVNTTNVTEENTWDQIEW
jgi:hypothetical protein